MAVASVKSAAAKIITSRIISTGCFIGLFIGCIGCGFLPPQLVERAQEAREAYLLAGWLL